MLLRREGKAGDPEELRLAKEMWQCVAVCSECQVTLGGQEGGWELGGLACYPWFSVRFCGT